MKKMLDRRNEFIQQTRRSIREGFPVTTEGIYKDFMEVRQ